jgi:hypothetical protein
MEMKRELETVEFLFRTLKPMKSGSETVMNFVQNPTFDFDSENLQRIAWQIQVLPFHPPGLSTRTPPHTPLATGLPLFQAPKPAHGVD